MGGSTLAEGIRRSCGGFVNMSDRIRVLTNNRVYRTVCIEKLVNVRMVNMSDRIRVLTKNRVYIGQCYYNNK